MAQNGHLTSLLGSNIEAMRKSAIGLDGTSEKNKLKYNGTNQLHDSNRDKKNPGKFRAIFKITNK